jgi:hypothetical protein
MRVPLCIVAAITLAACAAKAGKSLSSGTYAYSDSVFDGDLDDCNLAGGDPTAYDGVEQQIDVAGDVLTFDVVSDPVVVTSSAQTFDATLAGGAFSAPAIEVPTDWTTTAGQIAAGIDPPLSQGYDCVETDLYAVSGSVTGKNAFDRLTDVQYTMVSGSPGACLAANNSAFTLALTVFPCESKLAQHAAQ